MSDEERIAALEARLAALEARMMAQEARSMTVVQFPATGPASPTPIGPVTCQYCHLPFSQCRGHNICAA